MKKLLITAVIFLFGTILLRAQGEIDQQQKVFFRNERSFAFSLNSDGYSVSYRRAKRVDYLNKRIYEIDAGTLKHIKEYRQPNMYNQGGSFVFGKMNCTTFIRAGIGHQHELFSKADLGGIAIRYFFSGGPVLALYKPIYYRVIYPISVNDYIIKEEKFSTSIALPQDIYSKAPFTKGLNETKVMPGLYGKFGFNFEYSKEDKVIHAIEIGVQMNAFPKEIPIMANTHNTMVFPSFFVSYRFGMITDPLHPESEKFSNLFRKKKKE